MSNTPRLYKTTESWQVPGEDSTNPLGKPQNWDVWHDRFEGTFYFFTAVDNTWSQSVTRDVLNYAHKGTDEPEDGIKFWAESDKATTVKVLAGGEWIEFPLG